MEANEAKAIMAKVMSAFYDSLIGSYEQATFSARKQPGNWKYVWSEQRNKACSEKGYKLQSLGVLTPIRTWPTQ